MAPRKKPKVKGQQTRTGRASISQRNMPFIEPAVAGDLSTSVSAQEITLDTAESSAQAQFPFLLLPPEVRLIIYKLIFDTDAVVTGPINKRTFTRIYTVNQSEYQHDLALLRVCRLIHAEINKFVEPRSTIRDISATAIVKHMRGDCGKDDYRVRDPELLRRIIKLSVRVGMQRDLLYRHFAPMNSHVDGPLSLTFLDEAEPEGASGLADRGWPWLLHTFVAKSRK